MTTELTAREREVLAQLKEDWPNEWVRPMDIGGRDGSDHSRVLKALAVKGLLERARRNSLANTSRDSRGSYVYRVQA